GENGGIYRFPLLQLTANIVIRHEKFPEGFGLKSRQYVAQNFKTAVQQVDQAEAGVPDNHWLDIPDEDRMKYFQMMKEARIQLTNEGFYDPKMMKLLKKVRCSLDASRAECSEQSES
ncbi:MAG: putative solute-binding protein, partial [Limnobacter sp.]|nr:putative solute-binding protein [Limnobacter sp.]